MERNQNSVVEINKHFEIDFSVNLNFPVSFLSRRDSTVNTKKIWEKGE